MLSTPHKRIAPFVELFLCKLALFLPPFPPVSLCLPSPPRSPLTSLCLAPFHVPPLPISLCPSSTSPSPIPAPRARAPATPAGVEEHVRGIEARTTSIVAAYFDL